MNKKALIAAVVASTAIAVPAVADAATYARNQSPVVARIVKSQIRARSRRASRSWARP